jgi:hypothetical protein
MAQLTTRSQRAAMIKMQKTSSILISRALAGLLRIVRLLLIAKVKR